MSTPTYIFFLWKSRSLSLLTMIKALVFDFDGLMVDTETPAYDAWEEIYQEYGCTLPLEVWAAVLGGSGNEFDACAYLAEQSGQAIDADAIKERRGQRKLELVAAKELLPGILDAIVLAKQRGLKLAVASSSPSSWVVPHLDRLEVTTYFDTVVTGDQVTRVKPDPEIYRTAVTCLDIEPREALAIEDSFNGLQAAKAAGLSCVVVPNVFTQHLDFGIADVRLESFVDMSLEQLLARLQ